jgi:hypothetical protein
MVVPGIVVRFGSPRLVSPKNSRHLRQADLVRHGLERFGLHSGPLFCSAACHRSGLQTRRQTLPSSSVVSLSKAVRPVTTGAGGHQRGGRRPARNAREGGRDDPGTANPGQVVGNQIRPPSAGRPCPSLLGQSGLRGAAGSLYEVVSGRESGAMAFVVGHPAAILLGAAASTQVPIATRCQNGRSSPVAHDFGQTARAGRA